MKIYDGKIKSGKTTRMLKDFAKYSNSLFVIGEETPAALLKKCRDNNLINANIMTNKVLFKSDFGINDLTNILKAQKEFKNIFIDVPKFLLDNSSTILEQLECEYDVKLYMSSYNRH
jgi:hypothetical protein